MRRLANATVTLIIIVFPSIVFAGVDITIDGTLDEEAWTTAEIYEYFVVTKPLSLEKAPEETKVLVVQTEEGMYLGFTNFQDTSVTFSRTTLRDQDIEADYNEVIIDFDGKGFNAFGFKIGRNGAVQDSIWSGENVESIDWDGDWERAVADHEDFWCSELFIPWSQFSYTEHDKATNMGSIYLSRWNFSSGNRYSYPAIDRSQKSFISRFSQFNIEYSPAGRIDWFPYTRATYNNIDGDFTYRSGMDVFWRPTNAQSLNIALNPDYGQIESDDLVVNFSAIEVFFEERRPFFSEGHELFDIRGPETLRLIHTPRIGGAPDGGSEEGSDVRAAARYSYTGKAFDFGVLAAAEDDTGDIQGRDYLVGRARYRWQDLQAGVTHSRTERPEIDRIADVSVFDLQYDLTDVLRVNGLWLYSDISTPGFTDASDQGWMLSAKWEANPLWNHELVIFDYGDKLELNDLGYVKRVDREQLEYEMSWEIPDAGVSTFVEDIEFSFDYQWKTNKQGDSLPKEWGAGVEATTAGNAQWGLGVEYVTDGIDDLIAEGNGNVFFPSALTLVMDFESPPTSAFRLGIELELGEAGYGGKRTSLALLPGIQLGESLSMDLELAYELNNSWVIWRENAGLGDYDLEELTLAANIYYSPSSKHELRLKVESTGVNAEGNAGIETMPNGDPVFLPSSIEDFSESAFAVQLRYRYEISALSEAFIVYSRGGEFEDDESQHMKTLLSNAVNSRDSETLLFKIKLHF